MKRESHEDQKKKEWNEREKKVDHVGNDCRDREDAFGDIEFFQQFAIADD